MDKETIIIASEDIERTIGTFWASSRGGETSAQRSKDSFFPNREVIIYCTGLY